MTGLWIAVGVVLLGVGLYALALIARTTITPDTAPFTEVTETDDSFLRGDFERTRDAGYVEGVDDWAARISRDRMNRSAREARERFNRQGDPQ